MWKIFGFTLLLLSTVVSKYCLFEGNGTCTTTLTLNFLEAIDGHASFKLWYEHSNGSRDAVPYLDCDWNQDKAHLECNKTLGYSFTQPSNGKFYVNVDPSKKCVKNGTFEFEFINFGSFGCTFNESTSEAFEEGHSHCKFVNNATEAEGNKQKESECSSKGIETNSGDGNSVNNTWVSIVIAVVVVVVVLAAFGITAFLRKNQLQNWRHNRTENRNAQVPTPLIPDIQGEAGHHETKKSETEEVTFPLQTANADQS